MKKLTTIIGLLLLAVFFCANLMANNSPQNEIIVEKINTEAVWPIVKYALAEEGIGLYSISCDELSAKSKLFKYKFLSSEYMGRYLFTLEGKKLKVEITDIHCQKDGKWESTGTSLAFSKEKKLRKKMVDIIEKINIDQNEVENAKNTFLSAFYNDYIVGITNVEKTKDALTISVKVKYVGKDADQTALSADENIILGCSGTEFKCYSAAINDGEFTNVGRLKYTYNKNDEVKYRFRFKSISADVTSGSLIMTNEDFIVTIVGIKF